MLRVVIDTNVIVSGILSRQGATAEILNAWRERRFLLLSSPAIVAEIRAVLRYPRIHRKYPLTDAEIDQVISLIEHDALLVPGSADVAGSVPADPKDEMFLACALDDQAEVIVSGDHHLLDLGVYQEIPVLTARQFLERLQSL
ncbi:MAG TPA: putative toxin-antitoxin system toxin component, PIN family [Anaerolineales bacterium]|nr:putative toxin-antitoxin system toxin component, PIN family [Anaerolineales bacterium]